MLVLEPIGTVFWVGQFVEFKINLRTEVVQMIRAICKEVAAQI
jgi:hypothetical protein